MSNDVVQPSASAARALCLRYFSAHFEGLKTQTIAADESREPTVSWAVGVLPDGEWEALGAWPGPSVAPAFWRAVREQLDDRGVDEISLVCAGDLDAHVLCSTDKVVPPFRRMLGPGRISTRACAGMLRAEARRAICEASSIRSARIALERVLANAQSDGASVLSPDWPEVLERLRPFYALRPHRRALVRAGDELQERLGHSLHRAVARHGPFVDLAGAVSFVGHTLSREERRLKFARLSCSAQPARRVVGADRAGLSSALS